MRKLKTYDVPVLCRCLKKLGLKDQISTIAKQADTVRDMWDKGFALIWSLFDLATEHEGEEVIYEFLAGPFEMSPEEVRNLNLDVLLANLKTLSAENDLGSFFKFAANSMK